MLDSDTFVAQVYSASVFGYAFDLVLSVIENNALTFDIFKMNSVGEGVKQADDSIVKSELDALIALKQLFEHFFYAVEYDVFFAVERISLIANGVDNDVEIFCAVTDACHDSGRAFFGCVAPIVVIESRDHIRCEVIELELGEGMCSKHMAAELGGDIVASFACCFDDVADALFKYCYGKSFFGRSVAENAKQAEFMSFCVFCNTGLNKGGTVDVILGSSLGHKVFSEKIWLAENMNYRLFASAESRTSVECGGEVAFVVGIDHIVDVDNVLIEIIYLYAVQCKALSFRVLERSFGYYSDAVDLVAECLLCDYCFK